MTPAVTESKPLPAARAAATLLQGKKLAVTIPLLLGLILRIAVAFGPYGNLHPDEIFQYLEQGHRLAFGSGVVPWEYDYGIRSWLVPGLIAAVMRASSRVSSSPLFAVDLLRVIVCVLSLSVVVVGFRLTLSKAGLLWATAAGFVCAIWYRAVFFSPALLTEALAAYAMLPAVLLASEPSRGNDKNKPIVIGALLGLAFCLRFHMAPALLVIAAWYGRRDWLGKWLPLAASGGAVVLAVGGALDWATLGTPFQSIWLNFYMNTADGISTAFGRKPWYDYLPYIVSYTHVDLFFVFWLALVGSCRVPLLALTSLVVLSSHSVLPHKEPRFVVFTLLSLPILAALGAATLSELVEKRWGRIAASIAGAAAIALVSLTSLIEWTEIPPWARLVNPGTLQSFVAAHDQRNLCGIGVADFYWTFTGGYTYLDRDVPIYYSDSLLATKRPDYYGLPPQNTIGIKVPLAVHVELKGRPITQFPGNSLLRNTRAFNYLVARRGRRAPGYTKIACFANAPGFPQFDACLLRRKGGCSDDR